jgi:cyclopropane-fatty-acyl-phospholipid synthase
MNTTTAAPFAQRPTLPDSTPATARGVLKLLARLPRGELDVQLPDGSTAHFPHPARQTAAAGLRAAPLEQRAIIRLHNWNVFSRALKSGDIGFAESYLDGDWSSPDLAALLRFFIANREHIEAVFYGSWSGRLAYRIAHLLNRNSRNGSAENIQAHYDLGNDFYRLWLDPSMNYSAAWFEGRDAVSVTLQDAQHAKMRRALREAGVRPGSRVLEIGCGWGALAEIAIREFGAHVKGVTLSREQLAWAQERMQRSGFGDCADLSLQDYRDLPAEHAAEPFDAIVSIEMFEAVGREYWSGYFDTLQRCLKPGGRACIQSITIRDDLFERYLKSTDFIQQYIFPGGLLPSRSAFEAEAQRAGFVIENRLAFGPDYAETLRRWRANFLRHERSVLKQGFDTRFMRIWEFYLAYCEAAFDSGNTDVLQFTLRRTV